MSRATGFVHCLLLLALSLTVALHGQPHGSQSPVTISVVDENGIAVSGAEVTILETGLTAIHLWTDYAGRVLFTPSQESPYGINVSKPGFYQTVENAVGAHMNSLHVVLVHEQMVKEQVDVTASSPGIDTQQVSDKFVMNTPEIVSIPYPVSRDIRNLLAFYPGIVQDATGQAHVAGSETWATLDTLDGFDIRSPVSGNLNMHVSADAVRSIEQETTRYPAEFGRATGGVLAFYTGMGDNKFRFNATNFFPSFRELNGIRFDKFVPRFTFSGPIVRNRAWFFDGFDFEYSNIYIPELPSNANTDKLVEGSNLAKIQTNLTSADILTGGFLWNVYHSPYDGISALTPQQSTTKRDIIALLPYLRNQWTFADGALLDVGLGVMSYRDGNEPHGNAPYELTPELPSGSYFENETGRSQRIEGNAELYFPPRYWAGRHDLKAGIDIDHVGYNENATRAPVNYMSENGTLLRRSTFPLIAPFNLHNVEIGSYLQDRWQAKKGLLLEPGMRFDWDEIIRRPLFSPRIAAVYAPPHNASSLKLSAGIGVYYEHTQLEYLTRALAGERFDTYYAADGVTPAGPPLLTTFTANYGSLSEARAINWSIGVERKIPGSNFAAMNFMQRREANMFTYANESGPAALSGNYVLTNGRQDHYNSEEFQIRHLFSEGHTVFVSYEHSSARTNAALDYVPTISYLGPQQSGPLDWDIPNRILSWGWVPFYVPMFKTFRKNWDFVYAIDLHSGFPYTSIDANRQVVGAPGSRRFPRYVNFSPGLEWRFHFRGQYWGLRGLMENATNASNPVVVYNVVGSPLYGTFTEPYGVAFTARIRLIGTK